MKAMNVIKKTTFLFCLLSTFALNAQHDSIKIIPAINLNGPRVGLTYITGGVLADKLYSEMNINPLITQFGWQFESRYFTLPSGTAGLIEGVILVGGLEQGVFLPTGSFLIGLRNAAGLEFGFGPNLSLAGVGFVISAGITFRTNDINFPLNIAVVPSSKGVRISLLAGFNARRK